MQGTLLILFMVAIGAFIGGLTNSLAIKMLFRPHHPVYLGKWRLPFTPGLIPKRRGELARQMGKMVVDHLLTPDSIQRKFFQPGFQNDMSVLVHKELERLFQSDKTPLEILETFGVHHIEEKLEYRLGQFIEEKYESGMERIREKPLHDLLSNRAKENIESRFPFLAEKILENGVHYFSSNEGKVRVYQMIDDFLKERSGMLGGMLQMFLGNAKVSEKIQEELIKFLKNGGTTDLVANLLKKEWEKILEWDARKMEEQIGKDKILSLLKEQGWKIVNADQFLNEPLSGLPAAFKASLIDKVILFAIPAMGQWLSDRIEVMMDRLHLADIVQEQVESFSVERLEEMVLSISRREFKMITYLGALLGGIIGIVQGMIVLITG